MRSVQWVPALGHDRAMRYRILMYMGGAKRCGRKRCPKAMASLSNNSSLIIGDLKL